MRENGEYSRLSTDMNLDHLQLAVPRLEWQRMNTNRTCMSSTKVTQKQQRKCTGEREREFFFFFLKSYVPVKPAKSIIQNL